MRKRREEEMNEDCNVTGRVQEAFNDESRIPFQGDITQDKPSFRIEFDITQQQIPEIEGPLKSPAKNLNIIFSPLSSPSVPEESKFQTSTT